MTLKEGWKREHKKVSNKKIIYSGYIPVRKGKGIRITIKPDVVILEYVIRSEPKWKTVGKVFLSRSALAELFIRIPYWHRLMKDDFGEKK